MKKLFLLTAITLLILSLLAACGGATTTETVKETVVVKETVLVETEKEVVTEKEVEVVITATPPPAVQGGIYIEASNADASILNPILSSDSASSNVHQWFFPSLIGQNQNTGEIEPTEMAEGWDVSSDGLVWTFNLRDNVTWSDGDPVDAADFKFTYEAIASDNVDTPRKSNVELIDNIETPDPQTVVVTFREVKCDGLLDLGLGWLPSHLYADDFSDIMDNEFNQAPPVSAGPFVFNEWVRDDRVTAVRNPDYWEGAPNMEGWVQSVVPDPGARLGQLQTGEVDQIGVQPEQLTLVELNPNLNLFKFRDDGYNYIALNQANPDNPQPGRDEAGELVEQDPHPILSDLNVRRAIAHALDYDAIINQVFLGQGYRLAANVLPAVEWAHDPDLEPYPFDTEMTLQLLEEAGWVDEDGDGVREKEGQVLELTLLTNAGNTTREDLGVLVQDQLNSVGFDITFEAIEFGTMVERMLGQEFDMVIIGWTGLGTDPNDDNFWSTRFDTPGSGFNFVSYHNPEVDELLEMAVSVPGCDVNERAPYYKQIQQMIHDDVPYVFVSGSIGNIGYSNRWLGIDPGPWSFVHNIERWSLQP